jgi:tetratricopeptide (TPR) repeat protein
MLAGPLAAQFVSIEGQVLDLEGKPFAGVTIVMTSKEGGLTVETKTEKSGQFFFNLPRPGQWTLQVKIKDQIAHERTLVVRTQNNERTLINFKEIAASQSAELLEARKKQEEEQAKFKGMKEHFDSGRAALESATTTKDLISKTPAAERGPLTEKLTEQCTLAVNELEAAEKAAPPNEPNLHIVLSNLGKAYELAGRPDDAAAAFGKAVELKPDNPSYYQGLGTAQARAGKVTEAMATCEKAGKLPTQPGAPDAALVTAMCYGNVGIILQNSSRMKESVEPLKKATQVNPNNPDYWFLLGGALMNSMESKMEAGKMIAVVQPGTAEAYQKYLELAPTGRFANEAKENLETLKVLGVGIDTKVVNKKKKP